MTTANSSKPGLRGRAATVPVAGTARRAPRFSPVASAFGALLAVMTIATPAFAGPAGVTGQLTVARIGAPTTGGFVPSGPLDATFVEFPAQMDEPSGPGPYPGVITNRSLSHGHGKGESSPGHRRDDANVEFISGFEGLNIYQQRYARGGNQFTVEPPDQGLCAGNGYVMEVVNDVLNVYNRSGQSVLPDNTATNVVAGFPRDVNHAIDLNSFYGYAPAINRSTGVRSQFVTDPSCLFDKATQRWFVVVLTLETLPNGQDTGENHIDIAVSTSANPTGSYNIYKLDVTADGTDAGGQNPGPYLGDYPHIGADANGFYVTTNAYPWCCSGFGGAQIYALSKRQLAAGSAVINEVHIDTTGMVNAPSELGATQPGFTVWPAESPGAQFSSDNGGTEYFMSSNAAAEAVTPVTGSSSAYTSTQLVVWTLSNTASLNTTPALQLTNKLVNVNRYGLPPRQRQPGSGGLPGLNAPLGHCIDDTATSLFSGAVGCWRLLFGAQPSFVDIVSSPDSNDTRMQKVMYANGKLWGALDTALNPDGGAQRAGIAWYVLNPRSGGVVLQGYLGATGYDFAYPTMGITSSGRGLISFTASGDTLYPSAAYASIDAYSGVGNWHVARGGQGAAPDDGFSGYVNEAGSPRTRWGDYGATAVDGDMVWMASEYIASNCAFTNWGGPFFLNGTGDNLLGSCAPTPGGLGRRTALANWSTRISLMEP
jgi:hypothetical protein